MEWGSERHGLTLLENVTSLPADDARAS
ncbi:MAG: hypothetical protein ACI89E_002336, partial [Planctomycetota bacterium]